MKILVTGFDPFGSETINPAWEAVKVLPNKIGKFTIITEQVPTVFQKSVDILLELAKKHNPDIILCVGQAGGRYDLTIERVGINLDDARIKDNEGNQPLDKAIYEDGDSAYFVQLPVKKMALAVKDQGIPCSVSYTAGTFVCNHLLYSVLYHIQKHNIAKLGGFVHVPYLPSQTINKTSQPYMSSEMITKGLEVMIASLESGFDEIAVSGGIIS